ncbi:MAG: hypothetical protein WBW84_24255, partial [Acidobacteriaceae bacterium]
MTRGRRRSRFPRRPSVVVAGVGAVLLVAVGCTSGTTAGPAGTASAAASSAASTPAGQGADWPTYDRTADRSGVSVSSPAPGQVRRAWTAAVDGAVYAQPLIVGSEVIVATENDTVYA